MSSVAVDVAPAPRGASGCGMLRPPPRCAARWPPPAWSSRWPVRARRAARAGDRARTTRPTTDFDARAAERRRGRTRSAPTSSAATSSRARSTARAPRSSSACWPRLIGFAVAVPLGLVAGYYRGWVDPVVSRMTDVAARLPVAHPRRRAWPRSSGRRCSTRRSRWASSSIPRLVRVVRGETLAAARAASSSGAAIVNGAGDAVDPAPPRAAEHDLDADRAGHGRDPGGDHRRVCAVVPRPRRAAADAVVGRDAVQRAAVPHAGQLAGRSSPAWRILLATLSFNLLGDGLRDALDPREDGL